MVVDLKHEIESREAIESKCTEIAPRNLFSVIYAASSSTLKLRRSPWCAPRRIEKLRLLAHGVMVLSSSGMDKGSGARFRQESLSLLRLMVPRHGHGLQREP